MPCAGLPEVMTDFLYLDSKTGGFAKQRANIQEKKERNIQPGEMSLAGKTIIVRVNIPSAKTKYGEQ
jgi:hypothetical protein